MSCPFCDAADVERVGQWGGQMITGQWRCAACGSYFEALRDELAEPAGSLLNSEPSMRGGAPVDAGRRARA